MSEIKIDPKEVTKIFKARTSKMFRSTDIANNKVYSNMINPIQQNRYNDAYSTFKPIASKANIVLSTNLNKLQSYKLAKNVKTAIRATLTDSQKAHIDFVFAIHELVNIDGKTVDDLKAEIEAELKAELKAEKAK